MPTEPQGSTNRRLLLWLVFWFLFLLTPFLVAVTLRVLPWLNMPLAWQWLSVLGSCVAGAVSAGLLLAYLTNDTRADFVRRGIGYAVAFTLLHLTVLFVLMVSWR